MTTQAIRRRLEKLAGPTPSVTYLSAALFDAEPTDDLLVVVTDLRERIAAMLDRVEAGVEPIVPAALVALAACAEACQRVGRHELGAFTGSHGIDLLALVSLVDRYAPPTNSKA